jgi:hypothetical protein
MFMDERPFYEAGYHEVKGLKRIALPFRRLLRRVLRPILVELENRLISLDGHLVQLELRQAQLELRQAQLDVYQNDLIHRQNDFAQRQNELAQRQNELAERQTQLEDRQSALNPGDSAAIDRLQNRMDRELKSLLAMGWDHVAVTRRLAVLEDHIETLLSREAAGGPAESCEERPRVVVRYPGSGSHPGNDQENQPVGVQLRAN